MPTREMRLDPVTRYVRQLKERNYLLPREAAEELGMSVDRLKMLGRAYPDELGPGYVTFMGEVKIFLYTEDDLTQIRAWLDRVAAARPPGLDPMRGGRGRPPLWSASEHASRHRRRALARYHLLQAAVFEQQERGERAERSRARGLGIKDELHQERLTRLAQLKGTVGDPA